MEWNLLRLIQNGDEVCSLRSSKREVWENSVARERPLCRFWGSCARSSFVRWIDVFRGEMIFAIVKASDGQNLSKRSCSTSTNAFSSETWIYHVMHGRRTWVRNDHDVVKFSAKATIHAESFKQEERKIARLRESCARKRNWTRCRIAPSLQAHRAKTWLTVYRAHASINFA